MSESEFPREAGSDLLDQAAQFINEFSILPTRTVNPETGKVHSVYADMLAAWAAHTWVYQAHEFTPRVGVLSDQPQSGKTRVLTLTSLLACKPKVMSNYTAAVFTRVLNKYARDGGSVFMDETDTVFRTERSEPQIQGAFNDGFQYEGTSDRCAGGDDIVEKSIFCPIMFAGLKYLPPACMSRSILVYMEQRRMDERIESYQSRVHASWGKGIGESLGQWAAGNALRLAELYPDLPDGCEDRTADKWGPLFALAQIAGNGWKERMHAAYEEIAAGVAANPPVSPLTQLLTDIRTVWTDDRLPSSMLIERLMALPNAPWGKRWPQNQLKATRELANILRGASIAPRKARFGTETVSAYFKTAFEPIWNTMADQPEHVEQSA
jgi:hypothetical protein